MRNRISFVIASLLGALSIYCAEGALTPERIANADGGSSGSSGSSGGACCDTTPKWTKITDETMSVNKGVQAVGEPIDVSGYKELTLIRTCTPGASAFVQWGAEAGIFGSVSDNNNDAMSGNGKFPVLAPFFRIITAHSAQNGSGSCKVTLVGVK